MAKELTPSEYKHMLNAGNKQSGNNNNTKTGLILLTAIILCGLSFAAGISYQKSHTKDPLPSSAPGGGQFGSQGGPAGPNGGQRPNIGEVKSVSESSIIVSDSRSGSDQTFKITSDTKVSNDGTTGSISDIKTGDTVIIQADSSDSSTASRIILNPNFQGPSTQQ
jgi:hypothetical protein